MNNPINPSISSRWTNVPFAPQRWPFFYGWMLVGITAIGVIASIPGQTIGVGVFTDSLSEVLNLSLDQLSLAYLLGTITSGLILPLAGSLLDRWGTRLMIVFSTLGLGLSLVIFSQIDRLAQSFTSTVGTIILVSACYALLRFFGQGCTTMTSRTTVAKWFDHHRGLAVSLGNIPVAYFFNASPALLNHWVQDMGWRHTYLLLGALTGGGMAVIGLLFYRDTPESCGLTMDGQGTPTPWGQRSLRLWQRLQQNPLSQWMQQRQVTVPATVRDFTRNEAMRTRAFWIYTLAIAWQALFATAVTFQITAISKEAGLDTDQAYDTFSVIGIVTVIAAVLLGWLSDSLRLKRLLHIMLSGHILAATGLLFYHQGWGRGLFIVGYSIAGATMGLLLSTVWARYYGRKHLGAISGIAMSILVYATALGPYLFSKLQTLTGSYHIVGLLSLAVPILLAGPAWVVKNPQHQSTP